MSSSPARMKMIQSKFTTFSHDKSMAIFPDAQGLLGLIWPNFELVLDVMDVLFTCKNKEDLINKSCRMTA